MRLALALFLAGCGSSPYHLGIDLGITDDAAVDMAGLPDGAHPDVCKPPLVLVGIENFEQGANGGGRVLALSLPSGMPCSTYSAGGTLPAHPLALASMASAGIAVATDGGLFVLNADDSVRFSVAPPSSQHIAIDVFPLTSAGTQYAVVGYERPTSSNAQIDELDAYKDAFGPRATWDATTAGIMGIFPLVSATLDPFDASRFFGLEPSGASSNDAAVEVDPFGATATDYKLYPSSGSLISIAAISVPPLRRTVWVDSSSNGVLYVNDGSGSNSFSGPIKCVDDHKCTIVHAVPDPTEPHTFIVLCGSSGSLHRTVRRFASTGGTCDLLFDGAEAGALSRLSRLAIAQ